jgi:plasmid stability protein
MANLTITVDDEILRRARVRATEQDTSVNSILRDYLAAYAAAGQTWETAADAILRLSEQSRSVRGEARWTRDELHER